jgi:hypothetical protein
MTTTEHLQLIKSECERLLAIAEKRTQGNWTWGMRYIASPQDSREIAMIPHGLPCTHGHEWTDNASYIAACSGRAEAGWRSTIAAIDLIFELHSLDIPELTVTKTILAAWPIELLTQ